MAKKTFNHFSDKILAEANYIANNERKVQFRNNSILVYNQYIGERKTPNNQFHSGTEEEQAAYTNEFTAFAKKNLKRTIDILLQITEPQKVKHPITKKLFNHHLSIITLTISSNDILHPTYCYNKLLKPFIQYLTKTKEVKQYIWKMEWQKETDFKGNKKANNGQIHYHITLPNVIHWEEIRNKWNYLQKKNNLLTSYYKEHGHYNPNSTDIHKVYKIKNLQSYLEKEFVKSCQNKDPNKDNYTEEEKKLNYKFWDCSINLKAKKYFNYYLDEKTKNHLYNYIYSTRKECKEIETEYCTIIQWKKKTIKQTLPTHIKENYFNYINSIKNYERKRSTKYKQNTNQPTTIFA